MRQACNWALALFGAPDKKSRIVGRFFNRSDADDQARILNRLFLLQAKQRGRVPSRVVVLFDVPPDELN